MMPPYGRRHSAQDSYHVPTPLQERDRMRSPPFPRGRLPSLLAAPPARPVRCCSLPTPGVAGALNQPLYVLRSNDPESRQGQKAYAISLFLGAPNTHLALCFVDERQIKDVNSSPSYRCAQDKVC